jgi:transcriptional regulator with XRE-family HTH domain
MEKKVHQGKNISRFRQMLNMKQDALASVLGDDWNQIKVSRLEAKEEIEPKILGEVAKALKIPVEVLTNLDDEGAVNFISNTFHDEAVAYAPDQNYKCNFNPLDKYVEAVEKIEKLYEALLQSEREKIELMQKILDKKL